MTVRHLKIFATVAECGKMRKAAELLFISQPSVSQAIQELEKYYGVKLFDRISQKLYLTDMGSMLLPYARRLVELAESTDILMKNAGEHPKLRIGASVSVGTYLVNDIIDKLEEQIDNVDTTVIVNNTHIIEDMILNSKLDIAIVEGIVVSKDIIKTPLYGDELVVIVGKRHPYFYKDSIKLEELNNQDLISREDGSVERNQYEHLLFENKITMNKKWSCTNIQTIKNAVISGRGLAIVSRLAVLKEVQDESLKILNVENIKVSRDIHLIYHKDKYISQLINNFINICKSVSSYYINA